MMRFTSVLAFSASVCLAGSAVAGSSNHGSHWGYEGHEGPAHWAEMSKEYGTCGTGMRQSPIDISATVKANGQPIKFDYKNAKLEILNNGHTVQVNRHEGSSITVDGEKFELLQFHFHTPSENKVGGKPYDMEMHLVHKNAKGQLAVVGVFLKAGAANAVLEKAWAHMPGHVGDKEKVASVSINAADLLPADRSYNRFNGSLTTPPCSEGVKWFVMKSPIEVSAAQVKKFAKVIGHNARPVQALNNRFVLSM
jgi:carbonic anhydrase